MSHHYNYDNCKYYNCKHDKCRKNNDDDKKCILILKQCNNLIIQAPGPGTPGFAVQKILGSIINLPNGNSTIFIMNWTLLTPIGGVAYYNDGNFNEITGEYTVPTSGGWQIDARINARALEPPAGSFNITLVLLVNNTVFGSSLPLESGDGFRFTESFNMRMTLAQGQIVRLAIIASIFGNGGQLQFPSTEGNSTFSMYRIP